jgi:hypothetical protein
MRTLATRRLLAALLIALAHGVWAGAVVAQEDGRRPASIMFDEDRTGLILELGDLLDDGGLRRALDQGLPLRIRLDAELWRDGFFDRQEGSAEWGASVILDPVAREYEVAVAGEGRVARLVTLEEVARVLEEVFELRLRPARTARYYYLAELEVETLSLSDLDELRRWLGGDVAAAVRGDEGVENAVASGVRRIFVRALGLPARRERLRTPTFEWDSGVGGAPGVDAAPGVSAPAVVGPADPPRRGPGESDPAGHR